MGSNISSINNQFNDLFNKINPVYNSKMENLNQKINEASKTISNNYNYLNKISYFPKMIRDLSPILDCPLIWPLLVIAVPALIINDFVCGLLNCIVDLLRYGICEFLEDVRRSLFLKSAAASDYKRSVENHKSLIKEKEKLLNEKKQFEELYLKIHLINHLELVQDVNQKICSNLIDITFNRESIAP